MSELWTSKDSKIISRIRSNFWLSLEYKSGFNYFSDFQIRSKYLIITVYSWMNNILLFRVILSKSVADFTSCMAKSLFQDAFSLHVLQIFACGWARAFNVDILSLFLSFIAGVCYFWPSICFNTEVTTTEPTTDVPDYYEDYEEYDYDSYADDSDVWK